jgi:hypothetical protein
LFCQDPFSFHCQLNVQSVTRHHSPPQRTNRRRNRTSRVSSATLLSSSPHCWPICRLLSPSTLVRGYLFTRIYWIILSHQIPPHRSALQNLHITLFFPPLPFRLLSAQFSYYR